MNAPALAFLLAGLAACIPGTNAPAPPPEARIAVEWGEPTVLSALYTGHADEGLSYRFVVVREGAGGRSESSQSGAVDSGQGETQVLATSAVNVGPGDRLDARLFLSQGSQTWTADSLSTTLR